MGGSLTRGFLTRGSLSRGSLSRGSLSPGLCPWGSLSGGVSVQGVSVQGVSVQGSLTRGSLSRGVSVQGVVSVQGESLSRGSPLSRGSLCPGGCLCPGGLCHRDPPYSYGWAVHILLECILVEGNNPVCWTTDIDLFNVPASRHWWGSKTGTYRAILVVKRSVGVAPEVSLRQLTSRTSPPNLNKAVHSGFENQRRRHQKSKTGVSGFQWSHKKDKRICFPQKRTKSRIRMIRRSRWVGVFIHRSELSIRRDIMKIYAWDGFSEAWTSTPYLTCQWLLYQRWSMC